MWHFAVVDLLRPHLQTGCAVGAVGTIGSRSERGTSVRLRLVWGETTKRVLHRLPARTDDY